MFARLIRAVTLSVGAALLSPAIAHAGSTDSSTAAIQSYVDTYGAGICSDLNAEPTTAGIEHAADNFMVKSHVSQWDAGAIVGTAVYELCPQNAELIQQYLDAQAQRGQK